jgi:hypothetical protein
MNCLPDANRLALAGLRDFLGGAGLAEARISAELLGGIVISTEGTMNRITTFQKIIVVKRMENVGLLDRN